MKPGDRTDEVAPAGRREKRKRVELARSFTAGMLETLSGRIVAASETSGVLRLEVEPEPLALALRRRAPR
ncbi:MAG: hypothetical protein AB7V58_03370 [Solirubrobacterales bacterium]